MIAVPDLQRYREIYEAAFGRDEPFDSLLFDNYSDSCRFMKKDGVVTAALFLLPCVLKTAEYSIPARYLYAAATAPENRRRGEMTKLLAAVCGDTAEPIFLKPASESLADYYAKRGFKRLKASPYEKSARLEGGFPELSNLCLPEKGDYTVMYSGALPFHLSSLCFFDTLEN